MISLSCHVRVAGGGVGDRGRGRGCEEGRFCVRGLWVADACDCGAFVGEEANVVGCVKEAISGNKRGWDD